MSTADRERIIRVAETKRAGTGEGPEKEGREKRASERAAFVAMALRKACEGWARP